MTSEFALYMLTRCDSVNNILTILMVMFIVVCVVSSIFVLVCIGNHMDHINDGKTEFWIDNMKKSKKLRNISLFFAVLFMILQAATPTTKEMAFIYVVPKIVNSDAVQKEIPKEVRELYIMAKDFLKQQMEIKNDRNTRIRE